MQIATLIVLAISFLAAKSTTLASETPWLSRGEVLFCEVRGIDSSGKVSKPLLSTWEGDGIFRIDGKPGLYYTDDQELDEPENSLAMVAFSASPHPAAPGSENYVRINVEIDVTRDNQLGFYIFHGGYRSRRQNVENPPQLLSQNLFTVPQWRAAQKQVQLKLHLNQIPRAIFNDMVLNCYVGRDPKSLEQE